MRLYLPICRRRSRIHTQRVYAREILSHGACCGGHTKKDPVPCYDPAGYTILNDHGTSYMAVIDGDGSAISLTTTVSGDV